MWILKQRWFILFWSACTCESRKYCVMCKKIPIISSTSLRCEKELHNNVRNKKTYLL